MKLMKRHSGKILKQFSAVELSFRTWTRERMSARGENELSEPELLCVSSRPELHAESEEKRMCSSLSSWKNLSHFAKEEKNPKPFPFYCYVLEKNFYWATSECPHKKIVEIQSSSLFFSPVFRFSLSLKKTMMSMCAWLSVNNHNLVKSPKSERFSPFHLCCSHLM